MSRYVLALLLLSCLALPAQSRQQLKVHISLGQNASKSSPFFVRVVASQGLSVDKQNEWTGEAASGHVASQTYAITYPVAEVTSTQDMHVIWSDLIAHSDVDTVNRLAQDPAWRVDSRKVTFILNREGTSGFSLTIDQLLQEKFFWIPSLDLYLSTGDDPVSFADAQSRLHPYAGMRFLDEVQQAPEASYDAFKQKWDDMGNPAYAHPEQ